MMVQIVEHRAETSTDFLVEEEAVSSTPQVPNRPQQPSIATYHMEKCNTLSQLEADPNDWREPIITYIRNEEEPDDKVAAERIARQSAHYTIIGGLLYRRGTGGVLMKCIHSATGRQLLDEIHAGKCGVHATSRTLVGKAFRSRFYWLTAKNNATELVQKCEAC
jgi:hypothetical protein